MQDPRVNEGTVPGDPHDGLSFLTLRGAEQSRENVSEAASVDSETRTSHGLSEWHIIFAVTCCHYEAIEVGARCYPSANEDH
jgi:hypothetical protein